MPLTDWELWATAQHVIGSHGDDAIAHINDRIYDLGKAGDEAGVSAWMAIADRVEKLTAQPSEGDTRH